MTPIAAVLIIAAAVLLLFVLGAVIYIGLGAARMDGDRE